MSAEGISKMVWWGTFTLEAEQAGCWCVGPTTLWVHRTPQEWRIVHMQADDPMAHGAEVQLPLAPDTVEQAVTEAGGQAALSRFSFQRTGGALTVLPALPDRAVIVRPETPLYVLAGEAVTMYVSIPLWLRVEVGEPARLLTEAPSVRLSDTWFGPSTLEGELCYAIQTSGRLKLEELPLRLHRAVTPIQVRNQAEDALLLERIRLPVHYLSLYRSTNDFLWTQPVTLQREASGDLAALQLGEGPPPEAEGAHLVRAPRQTTKGSVIVRTFSSIYRHMF